MSVGHYENFPVASWLCPARLRPPIRAIYAYARTADDLADEGSASADQRLAELARYRQALHAMANGPQRGPSEPGAWPQVFGPLREAFVQHALPLPLLQDLLDAFEQDVRNPVYETRTELLDYCRRSANPIGRLLLHLYGVDDAESLARSDDICSALQLINFWQDLSVDLPRGRVYVPAADARRHGLDAAALGGQADTDNARRLIRELCDWADMLMRRGAPLALRLPGRIGWELRLVVHGGLRVLEKIAASGYRSLAERPTVGAADLPRLLWRAATMSPTADAASALP